MSKNKTTHNTANNGNCGREVRSFATGSNLHVRDTNGNGKKLSGFAIRFGQPSLDMGFIEYVAPTALNRTLKENKDLLLLRDHNTSLLLARTTAGTLKVTVRPEGLFFDALLQDTQTARDTHTDVTARLLTGASFGFNVVSDKWDQEQNGQLVRTLLDIDLHEISVTSFPAYQSSSVDARSLEKIKRSVFSTDALADDNADDSPDEDNDEDRCSCDCAECEAGDCDECSDPDCTDEWCEGCPNQDDDDDDLRSLKKRLAAAQERARISDLETKADKDRAWVVARLRQLEEQDRSAK